MTLATFLLEGSSNDRAVLQFHFSAAVASNSLVQQPLWLYFLQIIGNWSDDVWQYFLCH